MGTLFGEDQFFSGGSHPKKGWTKNRRHWLQLSLGTTSQSVSRLARTNPRLLPQLGGLLERRRRLATEPVVHVETGVGSPRMVFSPSKKKERGMLEKKERSNLYDGTLALLCDTCDLDCCEGIMGHC